MEHILYDNLFFLLLLLLAIQIVGGDGGSANKNKVGINIREFIQHSEFQILSQYPLSVTSLELEIKKRNGVLDIGWTEKSKTLKIVFNNRHISEDDLLEIISKSGEQVRILETQT